MIRPPGQGGVLFTEASDGDQRFDATARELLSAAAGIDSHWATLTQVHGRRVLGVDVAGLAGEADALWTERSGLPLAVFTADCYGVVLRAPGAVGIAHAGWRGVEAGVVGALRDTMTRAGHSPVSAFVGPGIGSCCFEVGPEVAERFEGHTSLTTWNSQSVDLAGTLKDQLADLTPIRVGTCTFHEPDWFSHRRTGASSRMATITWL